MVRYLLLFLLLASASCKSESTSLATDEEVEATAFFEAFTAIKLPYTVTDTNLLKRADTSRISYSVISQFVPDSVLKTFKSKKPESLLMHPAGKIENSDELYILLTVTEGKKTALYTFLFDKNQQFINSLRLLATQNSDGYLHTLHINTEPTFLVVREKTENNQYSYTKNGYAYSREAGGFMEVMNDSNEDVNKNKEILNPIDTFSTNNKYSGNYVQNAKNFISVRDGSSANNYVFFLHSEKGDGSCKGELKGQLTMVDDKTAVFQQSGDPCVIDFTFSSNNVKVKERGSCGNHRGMTCLFNDTYKKQKAAKTKKEK